MNRQIVDSTLQKGTTEHINSKKRGEKGFFRFHQKKKKKNPSELQHSIKLHNCTLQYVNFQQLPTPPAHSGPVKKVGRENHPP